MPSWRHGGCWVDCCKHVRQTVERPFLRHARIGVYAQHKEEPTHRWLGQVDTSLQAYLEVKKFETFTEKEEEAWTPLLKVRFQVKLNFFQFRPVVYWTHNPVLSSSVVSNCASWLHNQLLTNINYTYLITPTRTPHFKFIAIVVVRVCIRPYL